jgi:SAM-dependent methyltransferase
MDKDWLELWRNLVTANSNVTSVELIKRYKAHTRKRSERPDPLLNEVSKNTTAESTVIDIGAGSGRWSIPLARIAASVTAVEPSEDMRQTLVENSASAGLNNIMVVPQSWEKTEIEPHDIVVCAHAMYSSPDLEFFVRKMESACRHACYLAIRLPPADGIIGELHYAVYGSRHDSPNAVIANNALYSMGIYANILIENEIYSWVNESLEEAFLRAKRHLHLESSDAYDILIKNTLSRRLVISDNRYFWPDGMRSALLWWNPASKIN